MSERLKNRYYVSKKLFMADLQRVFTNCKEYNPPESEYYKCANILEKFFFSKIKEAGLIDKWFSPTPPLPAPRFLETHQAECLKQGGLVLQKIGHNVLKILVNVLISTLEKQKHPLSFSDIYI